MTIAIATVNGGTRYTEPMLQTAPEACASQPVRSPHRENPAAPLRR